MNESELSAGTEAVVCAGTTEAPPWVAAPTEPGSQIGDLVGVALVGVDEGTGASSGPARVFGMACGGQRGLTSKCCQRSTLTILTGHGGAMAAPHRRPWRRSCSAPTTLGCLTRTPTMATFGWAVVAARSARHTYTTMSKCSRTEAAPRARSDRKLATLAAGSSCFNIGCGTGKSSTTPGLVAHTTTIQKSRIFAPDGGVSRSDSFPSGPLSSPPSGLSQRKRASITPPSRLSGGTRTGGSASLVPALTGATCWLSAYSQPSPPSITRAETPTTPSPAPTLPP